MNHILESTKLVSENSDFVKIDHERLAEFSGTFDHGTVKHWLSAAPFDFSHFSEDDKLHFIIIFNAFSFCYWGEPKWTVEHKGKTHDGAWGMILALGRGIEEGKNLLDFRYCAQIPREDFSEILRGNVEIPLFEERLSILKEIGTNMITKYDGKASNLVAAAQGDAQKLIELIINDFPSFRDTSLYEEKEVFFHKRAQLLVADIYQIFNGQGLGSLQNINQLTACADYKLPLILRRLGIFSYAPELADKIDNRRELKHGSPEETEIRANTIWAIEYIKEQVKKKNPRILSIEINDHLWLATQEKFPDDKPYHLTRTTAY